MLTNTLYSSICEAGDFNWLFSELSSLGVRHVLACRIARQTEVYRTFALKLHQYVFELRRTNSKSPSAEPRTIPPIRHQGSVPSHLSSIQPRAQKVATAAKR